MRKYPSIPALFRRTRCDYKVADTEHVIEKGTMVYIPAYSIQNDPEYFPDPDKFDPDRFHEDSVKERHQMTWMPFGQG